MTRKLIYLFFLVVFFSACSSHSKELQQALRLAGDNRIELEKVLTHYKNDELKLKSAKFLIENMPWHGSLLVRLKTPTGQLYSGFVANQHHFDSLMLLGYRTERSVELDIRHIRSDFLIEQIELAFEAWEKPWSRNISFDDFCRYILPYRVQTEPLSSLRSEFLRIYGQALDTVPGLTCPVEACSIVNLMLRDSIRYHGELVFVPVTRSIEDIRNSGLGQCDDLTNFGISAMRSLGIPTAVDFTMWAHMNVGHSWCVVFDETGQAHSFGAGEQQPGEHITVFSQRKMAKVYRKHFELQEESLAWINEDKEEIPPFFMNYNMSDVTREYVSTFDVEIPVVENSSKYLYLCIFNFDWTPYAWSEIKNEKVHFPDMGAGVIYLLAKYRWGAVIPVGNPFILQEDGQVQELEYTGGDVIDIEITGWLGGIGRMEDGQRYTLYCWDNNEWRSHSSSVVENQKLVFNNVLSGRLYKLQHPSRCFFVDGDIIKWY
jgi:hypothetical protein